MTPFDRKNTSIDDIIGQIFNRPFSSPFSTDYEFAIGWELDAIEPPIEDGPVSQTGDESLIDKRQEDNRMQVVADLPSADDSELTAQLTEGHRFLEITTGEEMIERIPLPWSAEIETTRFNNGVLDVRLIRIDRGSNE
ncbi:alpha-crystallin domain-containing protein [Halalkalicoccus ordinarius]|uniref:hypothetical protein n=1 Tax=Halalkalicoccus ordinarius TaxID=3116651 RepID=UPI00300EEBCD